jgi:MAF protein
VGLPFQVVVAALEEAFRPGEPPQSAVARLAQAKARLVAAKGVAPLTLGCDTAVVFRGEILGKPADEPEARDMLARLRGRRHTVLTAIALVGRGREVVDVARTTVHMRPYSRAELAAYVATGDPLDKAGAYAIQHPTFRPVAAWEGCYANVVGLPVCHVVRALRSWTIAPPTDVPAACQAATHQRCLVFPEIVATMP